MPCNPLVKNGKAVGWICSRKGNPKTPPCYKCGKPSTRLCDFREYEKRTYTDSYGRKTTKGITSINTCDKPMCNECTNSTELDVDYCDEHFNEVDIYKTKLGEEIYQEMIKE